MRFTKTILTFLFLITASLFISSCNYVTHKTVSYDSPYDSTKSDLDPNYDVSLDHNYQDFTSYFYMGNRVENFSAYFNTFYRSQEDFNEAITEYRASLIAFYNKRLDSLGITLPASASVKTKLDKAIERSSKIIQYHKNSKFIDDAVLIIGKSYFYEEFYFKAERTFNEFLSKFSSSELADEAILFLGKTKIKLGKKEEGEKIFKNLVKNSRDNEIQSQASRDLGILAYNSGKFKESIAYFQASIDFSNNDERKAEGQFILAKLLSEYEPTKAAKEYKKVLDYTSDFDLQFYSRLNYAKGLIVNKDFTNSTEELESIRRKYREEQTFTELTDLAMANNLYAQKKYPAAMDKYYEVIVKYPGSPSAGDAYYYIAKHEEDLDKDYLNAYVNYKKSVEESVNSDFYKESLAKSTTYEKYFALQNEVSDSVKVEIPTANAEVEKYRVNYNIEKGIEQQNELNKNSGIENNKQGPPTGPDGRDNGEGKGRPGGSSNSGLSLISDSLEFVPPDADPQNQRGEQENNNNSNPGGIENEKTDPQQIDGNPGNLKEVFQDTLTTVNEDSLLAVQQANELKIKEDKVFNAYFELAELFMYDINQNDSAEYYLKLLLDKFPESEKQMKLLYTLGNFYKNNERNTEAEENFGKIISNYPNTIYASESRKILGLSTTNEVILENPVEEIFTNAFKQFNQDKYAEAISTLQEMEVLFPQDSLLAKSLYSIGWIYENKLVNKDSSLFYYNRLREKFPESEYTQKVTPMLEYIASLEIKDSTNCKSCGK